MTSVVIKPSTNKDKKLTAIFNYPSGKKKTVSFGAKGYSDYTLTGDDERRRLYLARHEKNENWSKYDTAGSLSRHILWGNSKSIKSNIKAFKKRFSLK